MRGARIVLQGARIFLHKMRGARIFLQSDLKNHWLFNNHPDPLEYFWEPLEFILGKTVTFKYGNREPTWYWKGSHQKSTIKNLNHFATEKMCQKEFSGHIIWGASMKSTNSKRCFVKEIKNCICSWKKEKGEKRKGKTIWSHPDSNWDQEIQSLLY